MKTIVLLLTAVIASLVTSCATTSSSPAHVNHDSMPGMTAAEHAKMKQR